MSRLQRATFDVQLSVEPLKTKYGLGEPAFARINLKHVSPSLQVVPTKLDPSEGFVTIGIVEPDGRLRVCQPPMKLCCTAERTTLGGGDPLANRERWERFLEPGETAGLRKRRGNHS